MEKIENYQLLQVIEKLWKLKKVVVVRIVIGGAFRAVSDMFEIYTGDRNVTIRVRTALGPLGACCCLLQELLTKQCKSFKPKMLQSI